MKKCCFLLFLLMTGLAVTCEKTPRDESCIDPRKVDPDGVCIEIYEPVCGCDNKTYPNSCYAEKAGVTRWEKGPCPE